MGFFRGVEPFSSESCALASIGLKGDITHARTAVKRAATTNSAFLLSVLNCLLLDPVIFFQSNRVFQFLANFRENSLVHSRTTCFFESYKQVFHALEHCSDRTDRVVHYLVANRFQIPNRKDGPPMPVSFTGDEIKGTRPGGCYVTIQYESTAAPARKSKYRAPIVLKPLFSGRISLPVAVELNRN